MSEKVEKIMKRIHVFFSNCDMLPDFDDKIIVPKKPIFNLLNDLNEAIYEVMEEYEATELSRQRGIRKQEEKGKKIMKEAKKNAEDLFASSMMYTDRLLIDVQSVIAQAGSDLKKEYEFLASQLESQVAMVVENQEEVREQLKAMTQSGKYMEIIKQYNDRIAKRRKMELEARELEAKKQVQNAEDNSEYHTGNFDYEAGNLVSKDRDLAEVIDYEVENFISEMQMKSSGSSDELKQETKNIVKPKSVDKPKVNQNSQPVKKIASVVDESALGDQGAEADDTIKRVSYEIKVNPNYFNESGAFRTEDLDAEYEQWKNASEEAIEEVAATKKEKRKIFPSLKKR